MTTMQSVSGKQAPSGVTRRASTIANQCNCTVAASVALIGDLVAEVCDLREQVSAFNRELVHLGDRIEDTRDRQKRDLDRLARNVQGLTRAVGDIRALQADVLRDRGPR